MGGKQNVQPRLQELLGRLEVVANTVVDIRKETGSIGDRMFGPEPESDVAVDPPGEDGDVGRLFSAVDQLQILVASVVDQVSRLRRL